jgi:phospholipid transport system substrate-binding protein
MLLASITFLLSFLILTPALNSVQDITELEVRTLMETRDAQIKALVGPEDTEHTEEQLQVLRNLINDIIDYGSMAKIALQTTFNTITDEQRTEFVHLFSSIIRDQSLTNLDIYRAEVIYDKISIDGKKAVVETTAIIGEVRTPVSYNLEKRNNDWFITDMAIDNVSTAESYRRSFQNVIRRRGFDALLENLRNRAQA